jgi:RES domain-containing protein
MQIYRVADYDRPLWVSPHRQSGRYHRAGSQPTQYWASHPAGAWAEAARATNARSADDLLNERRRLWVGRLGTASAVEIGFHNASSIGLTAHDLVDDDWSACQAAADRFRGADTQVLIVPSAALPGSSTVVMFGPRVSVPLDLDSVDDSVDLPVAVAAVDGHGPQAVLPLVRWRGEAHEGLRAYTLGRPEPVLPELA